MTLAPLCLLLQATAIPPEPGLQLTAIPGGVRFETRKYHEGFLGDPIGVPGMDVAILYSTPTGSQASIQATDAQGEIAFPVGWVPFMGSAIGPRSANVRVTRVTVDAEGVWNFTPAGALFQFEGETVTVGINNLSFEEVNAFIDVSYAIARMSEYFGGQTLGGPLEVQFLPAPGAGGQNPPNSGTNYLSVYTDASRAIHIYCPDAVDDPVIGSPIPEAALAPRHRSILAHEVAHAFEYLSWSFPAGNAPSEAVADFYASLIAGTPTIGAAVVGAPTLPRSVNNLVHFPNPNPLATTYPQLAGLPTAGGLHHLRGLLEATAPPGAWPEYRLPAVIAGDPQSELDLVRALLIADDDDSNLANGTPHRVQHYAALKLWHSLPWPREVPSGLTLHPAGVQSQGGAVVTGPGQ